MNEQKMNEIEKSLGWNSDQILKALNIIHDSKFAEENINSEEYSAAMDSSIANQSFEYLDAFHNLEKTLGCSNEDYNEVEVFQAAVAYINFIDNEILLEIVTVPEKNWKLALQEHSSFSKFPIETLDWLGDDYDAAREEAVNGEIDFAVTFLN